MFSVTVRDHMMIAHSFRGEVFGPAQRLHGATFVVDATFRRAELDADGIVVDIGLATQRAGRGAGRAELPQPRRRAGLRRAQHHDRGAGPGLADRLAERVHAGGARRRRPRPGRRSRSPCTSRTSPGPATSGPCEHRTAGARRAAERHRRPGRRPAAATSTTGGCSTGWPRWAGRCASTPCPGAWPTPSAAELAGLAAVARRPAGRRRWCWSTGWSARPRADVLVPARGRLRLVVLVHLPLGHGAGEARGAGRAARAVVTTSPWTAGSAARCRRRVHVAPPGRRPGAARPRVRRPAGGCSASPRSPRTRARTCSSTRSPTCRTALALHLRRLADPRPGLRRRLRRQRRRIDGRIGSAGRPAAPGPTWHAAYAAADLLVLAVARRDLRDGGHRGAGPRHPGAGHRRSAACPRRSGRAPDGSVPGLLVPPGDAGRAGRRAAALAHRRRPAGAAAALGRGPAARRSPAGTTTAAGPISERRWRRHDHRSRTGWRCGSRPTRPPVRPSWPTGCCRRPPLRGPRPRQRHRLDGPLAGAPAARPAALGPARPRPRPAGPRPPRTSPPGRHRRDPAGRPDPADRRRPRRRRRWSPRPRCWTCSPRRRSSGSSRPAPGRPALLTLSRDRPRSASIPADPLDAAVGRRVQRPPAPYGRRPDACSARTPPPPRCRRSAGAGSRRGRGPAPWRLGLRRAAGRGLVRRLARRRLRAASRSWPARPAAYDRGGGGQTRPPAGSGAPSATRTCWPPGTD